ncbi:MAG TPA: ABC transporter permease [Acidimicrobiia bacterium]|nr:ABC transporter permease [Acidimicrobiia bacterium]
MTSFQAVKLVTLREIRERARSKAFLGSGLFTLLLLAAVLVLPAVMGGGAKTFEVGVVGDGHDSLLAVAETLAVDGSDPEQEVTFDVVRLGDRSAAEAALVAGDVEIVLLDETALLREGSGGFGGSEVERILQRAAATVQLEEALEGSSASVTDVAAIFSSQPLAVESLGGAESELDEARSIIAYGGLILMYMAVLSFGAWTLTGIAEEKSSRVVEVLLATLRPWQLLAGKILGIGLLGLAQFAITVAMALVLIRVTGAFDLPAIPVDSAVTLVVWFVLGYSLFSVAFGTAGALVSRMEDAQTAAFPISFVAVLGFFAAFAVLGNPGSTLSTVLTFVPFSAPFVVPIRVAFQEIPLWEHLGAGVVTIITIVALVRFAGRVYAGGLLHFGKRLSLRQAYRSAEIR